MCVSQSTKHVYRPIASSAADTVVREPVGRYRTLATDDPGWQYLRTAAWGQRWAHHQLRYLERDIGRENGWIVAEAVRSGNRVVLIHWNRLLTARRLIASFGIGGGVVEIAFEGHPVWQNASASYVSTIDRVLGWSPSGVAMNELKPGTAWWWVTRGMYMRVSQA